MVLLPPCVPDTCGKDFRNSLHKPSPNYPYGRTKRKPRIVPAFTIQAMQKNTKVKPPPKCGVYTPLPVRPTMFRACYDRGEFPLSIEFIANGKKLSWKVLYTCYLGSVVSSGLGFIVVLCDLVISIILYVCECEDI